MTRSERRQARRATEEYVKLCRERDRRWDANRARYGIDEPQYCRPESFPKGRWELWVAEHPGAINVVAWRKEQGLQEARVDAIVPVEVEQEPATERQLALF